MSGAVKTSGFSGERIAKVIARAGHCSRRDAERLIGEGRVSVNGHVLSSPALNVVETDDIRIDGNPLSLKPPPRLWRYWKPAGLVVSNKDPQGRPTVFDAIKDRLPRVVSVGRLDLNSEGLLLLTNDGALARKLELPATGWIRRYRVRTFGKADTTRLAGLKDGVTIDGVRYGPVEAGLERQQTSNTWLIFAIREGKNREIRKICSHLGLTVNRLIRTHFGPFDLEGLERGSIAEIPPREWRKHLDQDHADCRRHTQGA
jgi:23S rRNA pseudouridine2605 synthase